RAMNAKVMGTDNDPYYGAPTILLVLAKRDHTTPVEDGSAVLAYMAVAAASLGLGTCWVNRERQMFDSDQGKALLQKWGIAGDYLGIGALSLGYPDGEPAIRAPRKPDYITIIT
ncbi:nitroreductase family protein, partial [Desulfovibrio sp. OttesenSCG-928-G15]|nr:nitroreductase family protein [Desulfovibrio sp. OttesenSCG-928-G15]